MADLSITAATALYTLTINDLFPVPQTLQGYAAEDVFSSEPVQTVQVEMGIDGLMSAGFVFVPIRQTIILQANSPSVFLFDQWYSAMQTNRDIFFANGIVTLISVRSKYFLRKGALTDYMPMSDAGKVLRPRRFGITWESFSPARM